MSRENFGSDINKLYDHCGCFWGSVLIGLIFAAALAIASCFWGSLTLAIAVGTNWVLGYTLVAPQKAFLFGFLVMPLLGIACRGLFSCRS